MSASKPGTLFIQAWAAETVGGVAPRPSWLARKGLSTRPPTPSIAPLPQLPVVIEPAEEVLPILSLPAPPPVGVMDLMTSTALAQLADENAALRGQLTEMASTMARLRRDILAASEGDLVELAMSIAERVVGRELSTDPALVVAWAREAVEQLGGKDGVVIAVARDVRDAVPAEAWRGVGVEHRVQVDAQLGPGAIEVRTPDGTIAASASARLGAVSNALGLGES